MNPQLDYFQFIKICMTAAHKAGNEILRIYNEDDLTIQHKRDATPLTRADIASHVAIKETFTEFFPDFSLMSEEGKFIPYKERKNWYSYICIDPLDGTKEFIKRNGEFTINMALIQDRRPVVGVICIPCKDLLYFGGREIGSYRLEQFSKVHLKFRSIHSNLDHLVKLPCTESNSAYTVVCSRSHMNKETRDFVNVLRKKYKKINTVSAGSSLKFCLVAEGVARVYPRFAPTMEWDTAAGQAIVEGSGGIVLHVKKNTPLIYNKYKLTNPWFIAWKD